MGNQPNATGSMRINRRDFVRLAGASGAGVALGGLGLLDCARPPRSLVNALASELDERHVRDFGAGFHGTLIRPADAEYDSARMIWNARFDRRPGIIARCADPADVQRAVQFARAERLLVAVRGGGHSFAGYSVCDGGLVIDLSRLKSLQIDRERGVVTVAPGLLFSEINAATEPASLAIITGGCPRVGIAGFTLSGGEGPLNGKHGLSCDNLLSADVVLADGRAVTASHDENPDLFWALRGGGGNFGVVTSFRLRAHPVTTVVAGELVYELAQARAVLREFRAFAPSAPDELDAGFGFRARQDGVVCHLSVTYLGDAASAEPALGALRKLATPIGDTIKPVSYFAGRTGGPRGGGPRVPSITGTAFLRDLSDEGIDAIIEVGARTPPTGDLEINHLHGAVSRVPLETTAFPLRQPGFDCFAAAAWLAPAHRDAIVAWVRSFDDSVGPYAAGAYVNMLATDDAARVRAAYGGQYARLAQLKRRYDPENFFRLNANVQPGG